jgi:beta-galactosidase
VDEFARIASDFRQLSKYGFPRYTHPEVAIAYSFDSWVDSHPNGPSNTTLQYFRTPYADQVQGAFEPLFKANIDTAIINIGHAALASYKLVVVPADYVMDAASAKAIREYVHNGGTVLMTAFSAKVDEHGLWFETPLPGRLSDVFGMKTNAFYQNETPLKFTLNGVAVDSGVQFYEVLELAEAQVVTRFDNTADHTPVLTVNHYGKGTAIYLATESKASTMEPALDYGTRIAGVQLGPKTPEGVYARVVDGRTFYVNTTGKEQTIGVPGAGKGILTGRAYDQKLVLRPLEAELIP